MAQLVKGERQNKFYNRILRLTSEIVGGHYNLKVLSVSKFWGSVFMYHLIDLVLIVEIFCSSQSFQGAVEGGKLAWGRRWCLDTLTASSPLPLCICPPPQLSLPYLLPNCLFHICFLKDKRGWIARSEGRLPGKGVLRRRLSRVRDFLFSLLPHWPDRHTLTSDRDALSSASILPVPGPLWHLSRSVP